MSDSDSGARRGQVETLSPREYLALLSAARSAVDPEQEAVALASAIAKLEDAGLVITVVARD
jgi:hypothetical protein